MKTEAVLDSARLVVVAAHRAEVTSGSKNEGLEL